MVTSSSSPSPTLLKRYDLRPDIYELFGLPDFPYRCRLSFKPLLDYWARQLDSGDASNMLIAKEIHRLLKRNPRFNGVIQELDILNKNEALVDLLLSGFFTALHEDQQLIRISGPFNKIPFFESPMLMQLQNEKKVTFHFQYDKEKTFPFIVSRAGNLILHKFYDYPFLFPPSFPFFARMEGSSIERYFQTGIDLRFVEVVPLNRLPELSRKEMDSLMDNLFGAEAWLEAFPPSDFEFHGLISTEITDVTAAEALSHLKHSLLDRDAFFQPQKMEELRCKLCTYFGLPDLDFGLTAIDYPNHDGSGKKYQLNQGLLARKHRNWVHELFQDSPYQQACECAEPVLLESITEENAGQAAVKCLQKEGWKSMLLLPLISRKNRIIGLLELAAPRERAFHKYTLLKIKDIATLFNIAMERNRIEMDDRIDAIIREEYTSLHPSVAWRFEENAWALLERRKEEQQEKADIDPIIFKEVYPLYGQADIVSSSHKRNMAIEEDLLDNLQRIRNLLAVLREKFYLPLVESLFIQLNAFEEDVRTGITSSNEFRIISFIREQIHPLVREFDGKDPELSERISDYFKGVDPYLQIVYNKRKAYEQSVALINRAISEHLDKDQEELQRILPHFYEKYETDGIAYNIYMGQSILKTGAFQRLHLENLRLWQLVSMCQITRKIEKLQAQLPLPLTTAQLILVHSSPLAIRFRMDEKRFDVDGAYNVRYEIVKKRIDKALVEKTGERLTLSGKIAIAYQREEDRQEYARYLQYLLHSGFIEPEIEDLNIQSVQGVQGLKALRVSVKGI